MWISAGIEPGGAFPRSLSSYSDVADASLTHVLLARLEAEPFNAIATGIFIVAVLHTFAAARFTALAHRLQQRHDALARAARRPTTPSLAAELLHFLGEIEVVFGLWAVVLIVAITADAGWDTARHYVNDGVNIRL